MGKELKTDMLRSISKQSGEFVESVLKNAECDGDADAAVEAKIRTG